MTDTPEKRRRLAADPLKAMIAQAVQHHLITDPAHRPPLPERPDILEGEVECYALDGLTTAVRMRTIHGAVREFRVQVREHS